MIRTFRARGAARAVQASDAVAARFPGGSHSHPSLAVAQIHIPKYRIWKYTRALSWSGLVSASKPITL